MMGLREERRAVGPDRAQGQGLESPGKSLVSKELSKQERLLQGGRASPQRRPSTGPQTCPQGCGGKDAVSR